MTFPSTTTLLTIALFMLLCILHVNAQKKQTHITWCVKTTLENRKCQDIAKVVAKNTKLSPHYNISCVIGTDIIDIMDRTRKGLCDVIIVDTGHLIIAGRNYMIQPIVSELYGNIGHYYSVLAVKKSNTITANQGLVEYLKGKKVCSPGMGSAAGWILPISRLLQDSYIPITKCNIHLQSVVDFFGDMCVPASLHRHYNKFGMNPTKACDICAGKDADKCSFSDPFAGYAGAFKCMADGAGDIAFLKHSTLTQMTSGDSKYNINDYMLICPYGTTAKPSDYLNCNWGEAEANVVAAYGGNNEKFTKITDLFTKMSQKDFGVDPAKNDTYNIFDSSNYNSSNLLFSDEATSLEAVGSRDSYHKYAGDKFMKQLAGLEHCPVRQITWCTTSEDEIDKCEAMMRAARDRKLRPHYKCIMGSDARDCMLMIKEGDADLIMLDAADTFIAGRYFNLTPIAAEDFGDNTMYYYAVAVAAKAEPDLTIFNLKARRACFSAVNMAAGWVVPIFTLIETQQIIPKTCRLFKDLGEFFFKACAPGSAEKKYNPGLEAINLCEACTAGNSDKCQRTSRELYYGDSGAFRCLVEGAGEIAFTKALAVLDNTNGRNPDIWARNRRSDDYELLCRDGKRAPIDQWKRCNLAQLRSPAIVTAGYKTASQKAIYMELLTYTQHFFSSDTQNIEFHMFDSGEDKQDLIFSDSAVKLMVIPEELRTYEKWLGGYFVNLMDTLSRYQCAIGSGVNLSPVVSLMLAAVSFCLLVLR